MGDRKHMPDQQSKTDKSKQETPRAQVLRTTQIHRSQAHTAARERRQQARRDSK